MLVPYGKELCDIPYVFLKTSSSMSDRPKALKGMLIGKTKNDEMTSQSQFDVMMYEGEYYYRNTLPSRALNRTKNGYNLFRVKNGRFILEVIE